MTSFLAILIYIPVLDIFFEWSLYLKIRKTILIIDFKINQSKISGY